MFGVIYNAVLALLENLPLLLLPPAAQFAHELTHFTAARLVGVKAYIRLSMQDVMSVRYFQTWGDWFWSSHGRRMPVELARKTTRPVTPRIEAWIGSAPTLAGLTAAVVFVAVWGWPTMTPLSIIGIGSWALYTLPSRSDMSWLQPEDPLNELQRSMLIGLSALVLAVGVGFLPYGKTYTHMLTSSIALAAVAYFGLSVWEHGDESHDYSPS